MNPGLYWIFYIFFWTDDEADLVLDSGNFLGIQLCKLKAKIKQFLHLENLLRRENHKRYTLEYLLQN